VNFFKGGGVFLTGELRPPTPGGGGALGEGIYIKKVTGHAGGEKTVNGAVLRVYVLRGQNFNTVVGERDESCSRKHVGEPVVGFETYVRGWRKDNRARHASQPEFPGTGGKRGVAGK